jgi:hypothetical protein
LEVEKTKYILNLSITSSTAGFPFTHVPYSVIKNSKNWNHILKAVGRLSVTEILEMLVLPGSTPMLLSQIVKKIEQQKMVRIYFDNI